MSPAWIEQLTKGGRLVLPLSLRGVQQSVAFDSVGDHLTSVSIVDCGFMPLRGALAGRDPVHTLGDRPGVFLKLEHDRTVDTVALHSALKQSGDVVPIGVTVTPQEATGGLRLWLAVQEPDVGELAAVGPAVDYGLVPPLATIPGMTSTGVRTPKTTTYVVLTQRRISPSGEVHTTVWVPGWLRSRRSWR